MIEEYSIRVLGCDDANEFTVSLTPNQLVGVLIIAHESKQKSTCGCEPIVQVRIGANVDWGWQTNNDLNL